MIIGGMNEKEIFFIIALTGYSFYRAGKIGLEVLLFIYCSCSYYAVSSPIRLFFIMLFLGSMIGMMIERQLLLKFFLCYETFLVRIHFSGSFKSNE